MKVIVHLNRDAENKVARSKTYDHVYGDPQFGAPGVILRNRNGGVIAMVPWTTLHYLELPENDTNLVASIGAGIIGATGPSPLSSR